METTKYSKLYRILHWSIAISFMLILLTIFLRLTWLNKFNIAVIIQNYLDTTDTKLSFEQILVLSKKIRHPMWEWHIYLGYILVGLFSIRFLMAALGRMKIQNPIAKNITTKEKIKKWTYIVFYCCVAISLTTGLLIEFGPKELKNIMEDIHKLGIYYLITYLFIHLAGVLIAEFIDQKGIISDIISGNKQQGPK